MISEATMKLQIKSLRRLNQQEVANIAFFLFFNSNVIITAWGFILNRISMASYKMWFSMLTIYLPLVLLIFTFRSGRWIGSTILIGFLWILFGLTYIFHPEYEYWFSRETLGALERVFRPDRAIYAYLFTRLVRDPKEMLKTLKKVGYLQLAYLLYLFTVFLINGYWEEYDYTGNLIEFRYSLAFGYDMIFPVIVFFYFGLKEKKKLYYVLSVIGIVSILVGGSRGPLLVFGIFIALIIAINYKHIRKGKYIFCLLGLGIIISIVGRAQILDWFTTSMKQIGLSSRTINMMLSGSISDGSGRDKIWRASINMIKEGGLFGYGVFGDRPVISQYHFAGYSHNIFLEILVSFGILGGGALIAGILWYSIKMIFFCKDEKWQDLFIIFFSCSCQLLLSMSFWYVHFFWAAIAIAVTYHQELRESKKTCMEKRIEA